MSEFSPSGFRPRRLTKKELAERRKAFAQAQEKLEETKKREAADPENASPADIDASVFGF